MMRPAALAILLAASTASAQNQLAVEVSSRYIEGGGLYAVGSSGVLVQGEVSYARSLVRRAHVELWFDGATAFGQRTGHLFGATETRAWLQDLTAGLRLTFPIRGWLVPQLRAGGGALLGYLALDDGGGATASRWSAAGTGYALGGIQFLLPRAWMKQPQGRGFTVGIVAEGGYVLASALAFSLRPDQPPDTRRIAVRGADLGSLSLSGPAFRAGVVVWF